MFNSYDKSQFVVGKEYYTYYLDTSNGTSLRDYTGIMKVKVTSNKPTKYSPNGYTKFEILESKKLGRTITHNIHLFMNGYGIASTNFYENYDECAKDHDTDIINFAKHQKEKTRNNLYKKLVSKPKPKTPTIETEALQWYESLSNKEKKYFTIMKDIYDNKTTI